MASGTTQEPNKAQGVGGPSSLAQEVKCTQIFSRLNKEARDPNALNWSERVLAQDLQPYLAGDAGGRGCGTHRGRIPSFNLHSFREHPCHSHLWLIGPHLCILALEHDDGQHVRVGAVMC